MEPNLPAAGLRCAEAARSRADPVVGSAPATSGWLLLEHPGPWRINAIIDSGVRPDVREPLTRVAATRGVRILLVRRPGRAGPTGARRRRAARPAAAGLHPRRARHLLRGPRPSGRGGAVYRPVSVATTDPPAGP